MPHPMSLLIDQVLSHLPIHFQVTAILRKLLPHTHSIQTLNSPLKRNQVPRGKSVLIPVRGRSLKTPRLHTEVGNLNATSSTAHLENSRPTAPSGNHSDVVEALQVLHQQARHSGEYAALPNGYIVNPPSAGIAGIEAQLQSIYSRLQHLERSTVSHANITPDNALNSSPSTSNVITSLRWALLRALEKPLRDPNLPTIRKYGLCSTTIQVKTSCDYTTFKTIASSLSRQHHFSNYTPGSSRVAFAPSFVATQSGSAAATNLCIAFTNLADLARFLQIRDNKDYEAVLLKEMASDKACFIRVLGTYIIKYPP